MEPGRRRTAQAYASWQASERRAQHFEQQLRALRQNASAAYKERGQLAASLDASVRQLGDVQRDKMRAARAFFTSDRDAAGSLARGSALALFGQQKNNLLDDLHALHRKLHAE